MSCSAIYTANTSETIVSAGGTVNLGSIVRRFGQCLNLSGSTITASTPGYYQVNVNATLLPTTAGDIAITLYKDGVAVQGATALGTVATASDPVNLSLCAIVRKPCSCGDPAALTVVCNAAGVVDNIGVTVAKL